MDIVLLYRQVTSIKAVEFGLRVVAQKAGLSSHRNEKFAVIAWPLMRAVVDGEADTTYQVPSRFHPPLSSHTVNR